MNPDVNIFDIFLNPAEPGIALPQAEAGNKTGQILNPEFAKLLDTNLSLGQNMNTEDLPGFATKADSELTVPIEDFMGELPSSDQVEQPKIENQTLEAEQVIPGLSIPIEQVDIENLIPNRNVIPGLTIAADSDNIPVENENQVAPETARPIITGLGENESDNLIDISFNRVKPEKVLDNSIPIEPKIQISKNDTIVNKSIVSNNEAVPGLKESAHRIVEAGIQPLVESTSDKVKDNSINLKTDIEIPEKSVQVDVTGDPVKIESEHNRQVIDKFEKYAEKVNLGAVKISNDKPVKENKNSDKKSDTKLFIDNRNGLRIIEKNPKPESRMTQSKANPELNSVGNKTESNQQTHKAQNDTIVNDKNNGPVKPEMATDHTDKGAVKAGDTFSNHGISDNHTVSSIADTVKTVSSVKTANTTINKGTEQVRFILPDDLKNTVNSGRTTVRIKMVPENLGTMRLTLTSHHNTITGRMVIDNPSSLHTVQSNINHLIDSLHEQGVRVDAFDLSLAGGGTGKEFAQDRSSYVQAQNGFVPKYEDALNNENPDQEASYHRQSYVGRSGVNLFA